MAHLPYFHYLRNLFTYVEYIHGINIHVEKWNNEFNDIRTKKIIVRVFFFKVISSFIIIRNLSKFNLIKKGVETWEKAYDLPSGMLRYN